MPCDVLLTYPKERVVIFEDMIPHGLASIARTGSFAIARTVKEELPEIPTVYGGTHATFTAEDTLNDYTWLLFEKTHEIECQALPCKTSEQVNQTG